jgi:uncharacterized damage-inducible protein DinB
MMLTELANIREHWTRYREVTLQHLDMLSDEEMGWRPQSELFTCGQHLIHILQTEQYYFYGLFKGEWNPTRLHFPSRHPPKQELRREFEATRARTIEALDTLTEAKLDEIMRVPTAPVDLPLRWWLWFILEHEIHHKSQLALYLRQLGRVPPFFAMVLPDRPDIRIRAEWGGA